MEIYDLPPTLMKDGRIAGYTGFRVYTYDGVRLGYALRDTGRGKWTVCIYDVPVKGGAARIENHVQISQSVTSRQRAYDAILRWHDGRRKKK